MYQSRIVPFYMAYPMPLYYEQEDSVTRDLEYFRQMYPDEVKKYQKIVEEVMDQIDYAESMIYDEYPDRWQIYRLTQMVLDRMPKDGMKEKNDELEKPFAQVLVCNEIYKRRHNNKRGILKF